MADYAWVIDRDALYDDDPVTFNDPAMGVMGPRSITREQQAALAAGEGHKFRMYDDDGDLYFEGRFVGDPDSEDGFGPLADFGTPDSGATEIRYQQGNRWVTL